MRQEKLISDRELTMGAAHTGRNAQVTLAAQMRTEEELLNIMPSPSPSLLSQPSLIPPNLNPIHERKRVNSSLTQQK
ncbi:hypothetical protein E2C01_092472 [Portunus trituberculatus]|uniref:Uncharacterized protein n=1 Tax=Portunus trituberculatus TaxID=210409 RepID=A0A5B7JXV4_PORTR|nr:hypothetical protein [Portunus trituberculatus]